MNNVENESPYYPAEQWTREGDLIHCSLCHHRCRLREGMTGRCGMRTVIRERLMTRSYGCISAEAVDPIEKKPVYHFLPGTTSYSLGGLGCNFSCSHCQNWQISQPEDLTRCRNIPPELGVLRAKENQCASISWTYNEPTISYEYTRKMAKIARDAGLGTIYVTNGYMTEEALTDLAPYLNVWRVDLKSFSDAFYQKICKAKLDPVLNTTLKAKELGLHVETVTLVIPGLNDNMQEIHSLIDWVVNNLGPDTPMHFTRFHPDYQMRTVPATPVHLLEQIYESAQEQGIRYPYIGNVMNHRYENTYCPHCHACVIRRSGFSSDLTHLSGTRCGCCGKELAFIRAV